jgi:predicted XRE-type DNA-binding protein
VNEVTYEVSSGNVFQDLGFPHHEGHLLRAELAHRIATIIENRHLTQREAAALLGINQPKVSALQRGHLEGFSFERLARYLVALGQDVEVTVRPASQTAHVRMRQECSA